MASVISPRTSVFWDEPSTSSNKRPSTTELVDSDESDQGDETEMIDIERQHLISSSLDGDDQFDNRTPLDKTIDRIGMGNYQWTLLSLCGFGWMADNMWIQAIAIILPRVQDHYSVPDGYIGAVSSSMFAGMMFGAIGWGSCSDLMGRSTAFNATLFFTALFGILASFARSFITLCVLLFFLGSAVGGSMPTDGTLLLEHMPQNKQYLVTALSVFFSFGAVLAAIVALLILPQNSCDKLADHVCDVASENKGWQYLLSALGIITLTMFLARIVFFQLHESPRYLVHAGRPQEALQSLQLISRFNGSELDIDISDVLDTAPHSASPTNYHSASLTRRSGGEDGEGEHGEAEDEDGYASSILALKAEEEADASSLRVGSISSSPTGSVEHLPAPSSMEAASRDPFLDRSLLSLEEQARREEDKPTVAIRPSLQTPSRLPSTGFGNSKRKTSYSYQRVVTSGAPTSVAESKTRLKRKMKRKSAGSAASGGNWMSTWLDRVAMVLSPRWLRTTLLVWAAWCSMSLAYTMFNVYLPKLLETDPSTAAPSTANTTGAKTLEASLWDVVIFTLGGCPGAILGAYMVESTLGRRWSLAGSTFITAFFCVVFVMADSVWAVRASTVGISLSATTMWAVLYGWTPEIFDTKIRGTACGIASALSRVGGMIAPMLGGILLMISRASPVYTSVGVFTLAGFFVLFLREDSGKERKKGGAGLIH